MVIMRWVPVQNKMDSDGYTDLITHENGPAHFAVWIILLQLASRSQVRGTLLRDGGKPHDLESISRVSRIPSNIIGEAIPRLTSISWLELQDDENTVVTNQHPSRTLSAPIPHPTDEEWKGRNGRNGREPAASPPQEPARKAKATSEEISAFCAVEGITPPDATWFFNKCEGNGWTNAGKAIKDWRATLRAWKAAGYLPTQKPGYKAPTGGLTETIIPNIITCED